MTKIANFINELNERDFCAFPQKDNPKRVSLSILGDDENRYFLTRTAIGLNADGTPKYQWARGKAMNKQA